MFDLTGRKALVTGATGGIGGAAARMLHACGAEVVLSGTRKEVLEETAQTLGERTHCIPCNLSDPDSVAALIPSADKAMGGLDILVNNAGVTRDMLSMRLTDEDWSTVLDINLTASFQLTRAALKIMMKARYGRLIAITSIVGATGNAGQANYAASKAGMVGMMKSIAQEVAARNITANCIAPGLITTAMTDKLNDKQKDLILTKIPTGRMGSPEDIGASVVFLASEQAGYITGQTLHVNGGMAMI